MNHKMRWSWPSYVLSCTFLLGCGTTPIDGGNSSRDAGPDGSVESCGTDARSWTVPSDAGTVVYNLRIPIPPVRKIDLVFVIDNSPSMAAKQQKLAAQFPELITALMDPSTGQLPDLRIAIVDSDMGGCGPGNGDGGKFQMPSAAACGITDASKPWLFENTNAYPVQTNFNGDLATVFACLASGIGASGCGYAQPLRALEAAFFDPANVALQRTGFLRPDAYLGVVIITDQDDCSAGASDGIFAANPGLANETATLRCATRAYACNGQNLTSFPPGYPTTAALTANFADCEARTDFCGPGVDTTQPTACAPLDDFGILAGEIKQLKADPDQILITGIFGWPPTDADMSTANLTIDETPNPNEADTAHPELFDNWPMCYDANHPPTNKDPATGFDRDAAAWGATAGLRLSAFVDEFGYDGLKYSVCQPDFSAAIAGIGTAPIRELQDLCMGQKLVDTDLVQPGVQPSCDVWYLVPDPDNPSCLYSQSPPIPQCDAAQSVVPCWQVDHDYNQCPGAAGGGVGQLLNVTRAPETTFDEGVVVSARCQACPDVAAGAAVMPGCDYSL